MIVARLINPFTFPSFMKPQELLLDLVNLPAVNLLLNQLRTRCMTEYGHSYGVFQLGFLMGREAGFDNSEQYLLGMAGLLHDIGKVEISDITNKSGDLTDDEMDVVRTHPKRSYDLIKKWDLPEEVAWMAVAHHEFGRNRYPRDSYNGNGHDYSGAERRHGSSFTFEGAQVLCACDIFDALATQRSYKKPLEIDAAKDRFTRDFVGNEIIRDALLRIEDLPVLYGK